ncbi:hypothetical protein CHLNCDRAFT_140013 [Chlorella variabilis]|uniref:Wax synthase domain-containing protein n=1 Tax=Chlorella variabilis TaxID=554065 RepID=E1ZRE0_CHLVA|nr:hypothetical protein CHLNCDRAFT_140013 [Chlorella variabilis]EFN51551.1 hypothetical protein CHLNCDRAFT_140013 [Chlorella variabilis]|eukprot:XP_005843653.1 hypothetical protein CHLNCDRAFT_140013 [Chlorella variabilis]
MVGSGQMLAELSLHRWEHKMAALIAYTLACAAWLRLTTRRPGLGAKLTATAPVLILNAIAPLLFHRYSEPVTLAFSVFLLTWLGSFKAVAAAGSRGPLAQQPWSLLQFWVLYLLPIVPAAPPSASGGPRRRPRKQHHESPGTGAQMFARWLLKAGVTAAVVFTLLLPDLPPFAKSCLYVVGLYTMLGVVMDGPAALVLAPLQLALAPHFLPPWESRSLADFWGLHWNQAASNALRTTIYDPIAQGSLVDQSKAQHPAGADHGRGSGGSAQRRHSARLATATAASAAAASVAADVRGGEGRRLLGMTASFFASGAVHELIFWYVEGSTTRGLAWLWFFTGQVPLILAERVIMARLKQQGAAPPELLRIALTLGVLLVSAHWLFFLPAEAAGVPARFAESMRQSFAALAAAPAGLLAAAGM